ncbi:MAG: Tol-Pal system beta propeller repeat protein TolB [Pseudomonadota bacterium]
MILPASRAPFEPLLRALACLTLLFALAPAPVAAQGADGETLRIDISGANVEPLPTAIETFELEDPTLGSRASEIAAVIAADLESTALFRLIPRTAYVAQPVSFDAVPRFEDWRAIGAEALVRARIGQLADGRLRVQYRVFDVFGGQQLVGQQLLAAPPDWRRIAHKIADGIYSALTGEGPYFDSRVVFVDETGPKDRRQKRLALMDQDGANLRYLPVSSELVLTPRFSPNEQTILYISYDDGTPQVYLQSLETGQRERLGFVDGMTFAPRFSPQGDRVVFSASQGGNTDIYTLTLANRALSRLTNSPAIDTAPSFSPDGGRIVFESDRGGSQQLYVIGAGGGGAQRISFGDGRYATPVWSPAGDHIAFTKIVRGRFHIGVMRPDGSDEQLLTTSFLDEGPTWAPNGRVLMFFREGAGAGGRPKLMSVDVTGRNLREVGTPNGASDPTWSPLRR